MAFGRRVCAAVLAAAVLSASPVCVSAGSAGGDSARFLLFSGGDIARNALFTHGGLLWSPRGLERDGFTFKAMLSGGTYRYTSGALGNAEVRGREFVAQFLPGWRFIRGKSELKLFAGLDVQDHRLSPDDPSSSLRGTDTGLRVAADFWTEPTMRTMIALDGSVSTIVDSYNARAAYGWKLLNRFYFGSEVQTFASDGYRQWRVGAHLTGFRTRTIEWSLAGGFAEDSDRRTGGYLRFGLMTKR